MPRRPSAQAAQAEADANMVRPAQSPPPNVIRNLLTTSRTATENMDAIRGSLGGTLSDAVTNQHLHKQAFGDIRRLDKLSPEALALRMAHFFYMYEASGLQARAASAPMLPEMAGPGEEIETAPEAPATGPEPRPAPNRRRQRTPAAASPPTAPEASAGFPAPQGTA